MQQSVSPTPMSCLLAAQKEARYPEEREIYSRAIAALLDADAVADQDTIETPAANPCAWCLKEQGLPMGETSHGICSKHRAWMSEQSLARKAARMAAA